MVYEYKNGKWVKATPIPYRQNLLQRIVAWIARRVSEWQTLKIIENI